MEDNKKIFKDVKAGDKVWFVNGVESGVPSVRQGRVTSVRPDAGCRNALVLFDTDVQNIAVPVASLFKSRISFGSGDGLTAVHTDITAAADEYAKGMARYNSEHKSVSRAAAEPDVDTDGPGDGEYTVADLVNDIAGAFVTTLNKALRADDGDEKDEKDEKENVESPDAGNTAPEAETEIKTAVADLVNDIAGAFITALNKALRGWADDDDEKDKKENVESPDAGNPVPEAETDIPRRIKTENPPEPANHTDLTERTAARETGAPTYPSVPAVLMITVNPSGCEKLDPDYYTDPAMHSPNPLYLDHGVHYLHDILIPDFRRPASLSGEGDDRFFGDDTEADAAACMIEDWIDSTYPELGRLDYGQDEDWFYEVLPGSAIGVDTNTVELNPFKGEEE